MARMGLSAGIPGWGAVAGMGLARSAARNSDPPDIFVADKGPVGHQAGDGQSQVVGTSAHGPAGALLGLLCPSRGADGTRCTLQLFGNL